MRPVLALLVATLLVAPAPSVGQARRSDAPAGRLVLSGRGSLPPEKALRHIRPGARRIYSQSLRLDLPFGMRQLGIRFLHDAAAKHGVALKVIRLRSGSLKSEYGIQYSSPSRKRLEAFEVATLLGENPPSGFGVSLATLDALRGEAKGALAAKPIPEVQVRQTGRTFRLGVVSEKNLRGENQDVFEQARNTRGDMLLLVFDGAGGHAGGYEAARKGATDVRRHFSASGVDALQGVRDSFVFANRQNLKAKAAGARIGVTTAVGVVITADGRLISANLGDSRAYRYRAASGRLQRLTTDHNGPEENIITQYFGKGRGFQPDIDDRGLMHSRDRVLLSSDGLHKFVKDAVIRQELGRRDISLDQIAANLANIAKKAGSDDNITIHIYEHP